MSPERPQPPSSVLPITSIHDPRTIQILSTEHWSLLASRSLAWNESFSRGGMFLSVLSGAVVALALVAQATQFGEGFRIFGLVILPVVLFIGIGTQLRLDSSGHHDVMCIIGMNRIRHAYLELAPDLERFFVMGTNDDLDGIEATRRIVGEDPGANVLMLTMFEDDDSVFAAMKAGAPSSRTRRPSSRATRSRARSNAGVLIALLPHRYSALCLSRRVARSGSRATWARCGRFRNGATRSVPTSSFANSASRRTRFHFAGGVDNGVGVVYIPERRDQRVSGF